ncbi:MAG: cytochrome c oxidase assembly protein [Sphingomonadales bacterium]|nr:cytochrome c oxidase assembly protein [Sphingomonadales bacterium]
MATAPAADRRNTRVAMLAALGALAMLGMGFAAVPLYRMFCQATGFGGTPLRANEAQAAGVRAVAGAKMTVAFDANLDANLHWRFRPEQGKRMVPIGVRSLAFFEAENLTDAAITGQATYNIEPEQAAKYFNKIQCFCFNQQTLAAHQSVRMPVVFYVDPKVLDDPELKGLQQITLSYTFHKAPGA